MMQLINLRENTVSAFTEVRTTGARLKIFNWKIQCNNCWLRKYREESTLVIVVWTFKIWTELVALRSWVSRSRGGGGGDGGLCLGYAACKYSKYQDQMLLFLGHKLPLEATRRRAKVMCFIIVQLDHCVSDGRTGTNFIGALIMVA